jgi:hypothetical protein
LQTNERILEVKRLLALTALIAMSLTVSAAPAMAGNQYGSVNLQWNVSVTLTALIHTNYTAAFANGGATATLLSNPASTCGPGTGQSDFKLDYGALTPQQASAAGCTYTNAVAASVITNDTSGFKVFQYLDAAPTAGVTFCAYPNTGAAFPMTAVAALAVSSRSGVGPSTACAAPGQLVTQGTGGTLVNAGGGGGQVGAVGAETYTGPTGGAGTAIISNAAAAGSAVLAGEDMQIDLGANQSSSATSNVVMTVEFVPN